MNGQVRACLIQHLNDARKKAYSEAVTAITQEEKNKILQVTDYLRQLEQLIYTGGIPQFED